MVRSLASVKAIEGKHPYSGYYALSGQASWMFIDGLTARKTKDLDWAFQTKALANNAEIALALIDDSPFFIHEEPNMDPNIQTPFQQFAFRSRSGMTVPMDLKGQFESGGDVAAAEKLKYTPKVPGSYTIPILHPKHQLNRKCHAMINIDRTDKKHEKDRDDIVALVDWLRLKAVAAALEDVDYCRHNRIPDDLYELVKTVLPPDAPFPRRGKSLKNKLKKQQTESKGKIKAPAGSM